jgi:hypothetical protein
MNGESCILALPHGNTTFRLTSVKPFNVLDNQTEVEYPEPERNGQEIEDEDTIVVNIPPAVPQKRGRGRPRKNADVTVFLQDDVQYKDSR